MKINIVQHGVIITSRQKSMIQKKLSKMKRYIPDESLVIDVILSDESSPEKGGVDQSVRINATFGKEKIFIEEVDDRLMRAFTYALGRFERQLSRQHKIRIDKAHKPGGGRLEKIIGFVKRKKAPTTRK